MSITLLIDDEKYILTNPSDYAYLDYYLEAKEQVVQITKYKLVAKQMCYISNKAVKQLNNFNEGGVFSNNKYNNIKPSKPQFNKLFNIISNAVQRQDVDLLTEYYNGLYVYFGYKIGDLVPFIKQEIERKTGKFFKKHINLLNKSHICQNVGLSEAFFERHIELVDWYWLSGNESLSEAFFERHLDKVSWWQLSQNANMSGAFFERHIDKVHWQQLCYNRGMTADFYERHLDDVNWNYLSGNESIPVTFFERHIDKVRADGIARNANVPLQFIYCIYLKKPNRIDWLFIKSYITCNVEFLIANVRNRRLICSLDTLIKHSSMTRSNQHYIVISWENLFLSDTENLSYNTGVTICWDNVISDKNISVVFIEQNLPLFSWRKLSKWIRSEAFFERHIKHVNWGQLSVNVNITTDFYERHIELVDWYQLSGNANMSEAFFERHIDKVNWEGLSGNSSLSEEFFERHIDKVRWSSLSGNTNVTAEFFERHSNKLDWHWISGRKDLSEEFLKRHINKLYLSDVISNFRLSVDFIDRCIPRCSKYVVRTSISHKTFTAWWEKRLPFIKF